MPFVKELILGIDSKSYNSRYENILNKFLKQTKFKKIKIKFLILVPIQQITAILKRGGLLMLIIN